MSRTFTSSGTTRLRCAIGANGFTPPITVMCLARRTTNGVLHVLFYLGSATTGASRFQFAALVDNTLQIRCGASTQSAVMGFAVADNWCLIGVTKDTGTVTPRFHRYVYDTNTWTHTDAAGTLGNYAAPITSLYHGDWSTGGDALGGSIALTGLWNAVLTDAQIESLPFNLSAWYQVAPSGLWVFDQDAVAQNLQDLTGNGAIENLETGTVAIGPSHPLWTPGQAAMAA